MEMAGHESPLSDALIQLESFLVEHGEVSWVGSLRKVRYDLAQEEVSRSKARIELNSYFGGMGSLNDLYFENPNDMDEFDRSATTVFRENRLFAAGPLRGFQWRICSLIYHRDLPPRIKNGFR